MHPLDLTIILLYLAAVVGAGMWFGRRQKTTARYFTAGHSVPWWAIAASIVATETSTVTFISVPGIAYAQGGNFTFLQLVLGYLVARVIIATVFMPWYFAGELVTVYELLHSRFGASVRGLAASLFVVMRTIGDGIRLLLTGLVVAAVFRSIGATAAVSGAVIALGAIMIVFTLAGGIEAIVWIEVVQLAIYITGALAAGVVLLQHVGFGEAIAIGEAAGKFTFFDFALDPKKTYGFWAGLIGGTFLTLSTHGTDQYLVQRYLCTDRPRNAAKALLVSGVVVLVQFAAFLFIGVLLFAFYRPDLHEAVRFTSTDQVFPDFITRHLPIGLSGLVVAAILAAAMSSSLNAIAATVVADLYRPIVRGRDDRHYLRVSYVVTVIAGIAQIAVGVAMQHENRAAVNTALSVASLINGPILGVFFLGALKRGRTAAALIAMTCGLAVVLSVAFLTKTAWPWYTVIGSLTTLGVGLIVALTGGDGTDGMRADERR
ncbi:MAG TPA: sodium:solute symporter [Thermoanaerobaculia bacterium]|jgi:SSS family transporter